jgi:hypothetical protein
VEGYYEEGEETIYEVFEQAPLGVSWHEFRAHVYSLYCQVKHTNMPNMFIMHGFNEASERLAHKAYWSNETSGYVHHTWRGDELISTYQTTDDIPF